MTKGGWRRLSSILFYFLALFLIIAPASSLAIISKITPSPTPVLAPTPSPSSSVNPISSPNPSPSTSPGSKLDQPVIQTASTNSLAIYDVSGDRIISSEDLMKVRSNFTDKCRVPCQYDFTGDGKVNNADLLVLRENLGKVVLNTTPARIASDTFIPDELLIKFDPNISTERKTQIYKENRIKRLAGLGRPGSDNVKFASQDIDQLIEELKNTPGVLIVGKNTLAKLNYTPNDTKYYKQWNLNTINMPKAWDQTKGLPSVKIAIVDTGVGPHPDINGKLVPGYNAVDENTDTADIAGHGTQVAGIAAAATDNGQGIAGVGFYSMILPLRACIPYLTIYQCPEAYTTRAIEWLNGNVLASGEKVVINMSYGSSGSRPFEKAALDVAVQLGAIPVASIGNEGKNQIDYPAHYDNVVAVGAVLADKTRSSSSNYGSELDVMAPTGIFTITSPPDSDGYFILDGTSASSPQVAGVAALYYTVGGKAPWYEFQTNTDLFLKFALQGSEDLGAPGRDDYYGYGLLNAWDALKDKSCSRSDLNGDKEINIIDGQMIGYRYGTYAGDPLYAVGFDLDPYQKPDGDIDIKDLLKVFVRMGMFCF